MFILTDRQKNKPLYGEPLEPEKSATSGDNVHLQLLSPFILQGFLLSSVFQDESAAIQTAVGSFFPILLLKTRARIKWDTPRGEVQKTRCFRERRRQVAL